MTAVLTALGTLGTVVLAGYVLGRVRVLGPEATQVLAKVVFTVAIPALLVVTVGGTDLHVVLSRTAAATVLSTTVLVVLVVLVLGALWRRPAADAAVTTLAASYVNSVHLGLPLAMYLFGDAVVVVPTMLFQQLLLAPVAFVVLEAARAPGRGRGEVLQATGARMLRNPIVLATTTGLLLAALPWRVPDVVAGPFELVGAAAAPMALLVFGASLAGRRADGARAPRREVWFATLAKSLLHPALALLAGRVLGLADAELLVVAGMAALPTAQNVLVYALAYRRGEAVARDVGLWSTLLLAPVLLVLAALLGG